MQAYVKTQKSEFQQWLDSVQKSSETEKVKLIDEFMTNQKTFPIIESNNIVHFIYRGTAEDLALNADHTGIWDEIPMNHIKGSDFFYSTHKLEPDARIKYRYIKDLEEKSRKQEEKIQAEKNALEEETKRLENKLTQQDQVQTDVIHFKHIESVFLHAK